MATLEPLLRERLMALRDAEPARRLDCLVTLAEGQRPEGLLPGPPVLWVELTRLAALPLSAQQALSLAEDPRVERIELDGQAQALPG